MVAEKFNTCPKCDYKRTEQDDEFYSSEECPNCGVIYSKARETEESIEETTNYLEGQVLCSDETCCGKIGPDDRCSECGKTLEQASNSYDTDNDEIGLTTCEVCNRKISPRAISCPGCGDPKQNQANLSGENTFQKSTPPPFKSSAGRNRYVAALLAFFFGGFGVHKFYLGQIFLGLIYLIFCWTFIPALIGFIESIILFAMSEDQFNRKHNDARNFTPNIFKSKFCRSCNHNLENWFGNNCPNCGELVSVGFQNKML